MTPNTKIMVGSHGSPLQPRSMSFDHRAWLIAVVIWVLLMLALIASCMRNHLHGRSPVIMSRLSQYLYRGIGWLTNDERLWHTMKRYLRILRSKTKPRQRLLRVRRQRRQLAGGDLEEGFINAPADSGGAQQPAENTEGNELGGLSFGNTLSTRKSSPLPSSSSMPSINSPKWWSGSALTITDRRNRSL